MKKKIRGIIVLLIATIIWGSAFSAQSEAMKCMGPFSFQAVRCFLAVLVLIPASAIADKFKNDGSTFVKRWSNKKLWIAGLLCGIPLFLACNLQQLGLDDNTDPGKSGFLTAMYIIIVPILGIFLKKKPTIMIPISVALATVGLYFLSCMGVTQISTGDLLTLGCALAFAVQITFVDRFANNTDALRLNAIQALVCTILSTIVMIFTEQLTWNGIFQSSFYLVHTGVFSMGAGYFLQIVGQQDLDSTPASLLMSLESVFAALFAWLFLQKAMGGWEILGAGLILIAVILSQIPVKLKKKIA